MTNDELIEKTSKMPTRLVNECVAQWVVDIIPAEDVIYYIILQRGRDTRFSVFSLSTHLFSHKEYRECLRFVKNQFPDKSIPRAKVRFPPDRILGQKK